MKEIEDVLRRELVAASTLTDRPVSPNNYATQRTNVVMETVKAATLATARKLEKLAAEQRKKGKGILEFMTHFGQNWIFYELLKLLKNWAKDLYT